MGIAALNHELAAKRRGDAAADRPDIRFCDFREIE